MTNTIEIPEPKISRILFKDVRTSWLWLVLRVYVGWEWLSAGWEKVNSSAWTGSGSGMALKGFLKGALGKASGANPQVSSWYASFINNVALQHLSLFSYLVAYGELLVGIALILGAFTGIAAFFGAFMNINYLLAGTVSINPILLVVELFIMLAWRNAGWLGIDRWLLPAFGAPWQPGKMFKRR